MNKTDHHERWIRKMFWGRDRAIAAFIVAACMFWLPMTERLAFLMIVVATVFASICWFAMFRITDRTHGPTYAFLHVAVSILLTPALLSGLILIPLLVKGDHRRLMTKKSPVKNLEL